GAAVANGAAGAVRTVELRRTDGTLAGRYRFEGTRLAGFQWQEGGLAARRVESEEFERLREQAAPIATPPPASTPSASSTSSPNPTSPPPTPLPFAASG